MVRAGAYVSEDLAPVPGLGAQQTTEAGLRARVNPPVMSGPWRAWAFLGAGGARAALAGSAGEFVDVCAGTGVAYKLRRPWDLFVELEARATVASFGGLYERSPGHLYDGHDVLAVALSAGVSLDE
jgi:hypothetical protein